MYACTAPALTRKGRAPTYPDSNVSAWTRKRPAELFPTSMPSPVRSKEHVSTHTRSPRPSGRIEVIVARSSGTASRTDSRTDRNARTSFAPDVVRRTPSTPTSIVSKNNFASAASWTSTRSRVPLPWKCAIRFSSGMTFQSSVRTTTCFVVPRRARTPDSSLAERIVVEKERVVLQENRREAAETCQRGIGCRQHDLIEPSLECGRDDRPNVSFVPAGKGPHPHQAVHGAHPR